MPGRRLSLEERFWAKVAKGDGCWEWTGAFHEGGYGIIGLGGRKDGVARAHRLSYEMHHGPIGPDLVVCHRCDNRKCVRPDHLFLGSQQVNVDDMKAKGRAVDPPLLLGEKNPRARLIEIDGQRKCISEWARINGVNVNTVKTRLRAGWPAERAVKRSA